MSISGHDMWVFVGERGHPGGNVEVSKKKKRRMDTSLRKKFKVTRQKRVLKEIEYRLSC